MKEPSTLQLYFKDINKYPLLSREEERDYVTKAQAGDKDAYDKLTTSNLRFVVKVAKHYCGHGLDLDELISEGNIGLMKSVNRFDSKKGFHFLSYAVWWIRRSIINALTDKSRTIRLPIYRVEQLMKINRKIEDHSLYEFGDSYIKEIAKEVGLGETLVQDLINLSNVSSLDSPVDIEDSGSITFKDTIEDERSDPQKIAIYSTMKDEINYYLNNLTEQQKEIIEERFGLNGKCPSSLKEVGINKKLSKERIRQIQNKALKQLGSYDKLRDDRLASYLTID